MLERLATAELEQREENPRADPAHRLDPGLVLGVHERDEVRAVGPQSGHMAIPAAREAAEVVRDEMRGDVAHGPAGTDGRRVPSRGIEGGQELQQAGSLDPKQTDDQDRFDGSQHRRAILAPKP